MFKSVAPAAALVEAGLDLTKDRLYEHIKRHRMLLYYRPRKHVSWKLIGQLHQRERYQSPMEAMASLLGSPNANELDPVPAFIRALWQPSPIPRIDQRDESLRKIENLLNSADVINVFTDGSVRYGLAGVGVYTPPSI